MQTRNSRLVVLGLVALFFLMGFMARAQQCELFRSEITDVREFEIKVNKLTDSLKVYAENAAFAARFTEGRNNAKKVQFLAGEALAAANQAVEYAAEAQYHAEVCGISAVVSHAIKSEELSINVRDYMQTVYDNAKKASASGKLGDVHYYMRRSLQAAREACKTAELAVYAAYDAHGSCTHRDDTYTGKG